MKKCGCTKTGSGTVEFLLFVVLSGFIFAAFLEWSRWILTRQRALSWARWGAELVSSNKVDLSLIEAEMARSLPDAYRFEINRFVDSSAARFYRLKQSAILVNFPFPFPSIKEVVVMEEAHEE